MGCNRVVASEGYGPRLQCALHREEFIAYLLAVQVLDDIICQANLLEFAEGVALHNHALQQLHTPYDKGICNSPDSHYWSRHIPLPIEIYSARRHVIVRGYQMMHEAFLAAALQRLHPEAYN